ncbi:ROK family protein, partial [Acinetobacter baumannii]
MCTLSPQRIILGGGVMKKTQLFPLIRAQVLELLNNYVRADAIIKQIDSFVVPPALGDRAGILGSMVLAETALE